jgi:hypothetical protein
VSWGRTRPACPRSEARGSARALACRWGCWWAPPSEPTRHVTEKRLGSRARRWRDIRKHASCGRLDGSTLATVESKACRGIRPFCPIRSRRLTSVGERVGAPVGDSVGAAVGSCDRVGMIGGEPCAVIERGGRVSLHQWARTWGWPWARLSGPRWGWPWAPWSGMPWGPVH